MAVHSQDMNTPDCPRGWEMLWRGYSFAMVRIYTTFPELTHYDIFNQSDRSECFVLNVHFVSSVNFKLVC